jgi:hypothetical protein
MRYFLGPFLFVGLVGLALILAFQLTNPSVHGEQPTAMKVNAPAFEGIEEWINSKPLTWKDLKGQVVVVHFWTFG